MNNHSTYLEYKKKNTLTSIKMAKKESTRSKKDDIPKKSKSRKTEEIEDEDGDEEFEIEIPSKKDKKSKLSKKKSKNDDEDELSDLDVDDQDIVKSSPPKAEKHTFKEVDPTTQIDKLTVGEICAYLFFKGEKEFNPKLKFGALNLFKDLTGKKKKHPAPRQYGAGPNRGGNYSRNMYHSQHMTSYSGGSKRGASNLE